MPRELVAVAPRTPVLREYAEALLEARQIRIQTEFASPKHGTELVGYRNEPSALRPYDAYLGAAVRRTPEEMSGAFPKRLGNMAVGRVVEVGPEVTRFATGDRVFGHFPIRETQTVDEGRADPMPPGMSDEAAVCLDPAVMALPMRDANLKLGDTVAVFGLGAIGLMAVQVAKLAGADRVFAVDPLANRRLVAYALGADAPIDPGDVPDGDVGLAIRRLTPPVAPLATAPDPVRIVGGYHEKPSQWGGFGVDVAVETAGAIPALQAAIRATRFGGTIAMVSYYGRDAAGLHLGDEFHVNRLQLVSVRAESLPLRDFPGWTLERLVDLALRWLRDGRLRTDGIVAPIVPFADAADAYREIDEHPERSIKLGIRF